MKVNSYEYRNEGEYVVVKIPRCVLVFTRAQWINAIKRGRGWRRYGAEKMTKQGGHEK